MNLSNTIEELKCTASGLRLPDLRRVISNLKPDRVAVAVADAIKGDKSTVVLPTRAIFTYLPFQGLTRTVSQLLTPS